METCCSQVLRSLHEISPSDQILLCGEDIVTRLFNQTEDLARLAEQQLRVFPFKNVRSCWFRLYTDIHLLKATRLLQSYSSTLSRDDCSSAEHTSSDQLSDSSTMSEVVRLLDMALIMAGGLGRHSEIHRLFQLLREDVIVPQVDQLRVKQRKLRTRAANGQDGEESTSSVKSLPSLDVDLPIEVSSLPKIQHPIVRQSLPSMLDFEKHMWTTKTPQVLTNIMTHWPGMAKWHSVSYWMDLTIGGRRLVPVEIGRSYTDDDWRQEIMPFRQFLENFIMHQDDEYFKSGQASDSHKTGYLAQHDLFSQIPSLWADIATPDYCYLDAPPAEIGTPVAAAKQKATIEHNNLPKSSHPVTIATATKLGSNDEAVQEGHEDTSTSDVQSNIWFGPAWTITPLHHDPYHNILCQVVGKKYIRLYAPCYSDMLHPKSKDTTAPHLPPGLGEEHNLSEAVNNPTINMSNTSSIDVAAMELSPAEDWNEQYPGISEIPYIECILNAGEALYIPIGWWHYVRSCSVGISVSFWWEGTSQQPDI